MIPSAPFSPEQPPQPKTSSRYFELLAWCVCCLSVAGIFLLYVATSTSNWSNDILMPLDDPYIHFQYARQLVSGEPYVYNPGEDPTSGATSFIYPYVLAVGYALGFDGLTLGYWAMGVGALALLAAMWLVYKLVQQFTDSPRWLALTFAVIFGINGAISWHFMSGMETGLVITFALATLYAFMRGDLRAMLFAASGLALLRPEAGIMAGIAVVIFVFRAYREKHLNRSYVWLIIPLLLIALQPTMNFLLTGSFSATGNQAKSILAMVPFEWTVVIDRIVSNFVQMWRELALTGDYAPLLIAPLALVGWGALWLKRDQRYVVALLLLWFLALTGAIATLDTAFWHFKRYQMPMIALLFPLAGWGIVALSSLLAEREPRYRLSLQAITVLILLVMVLPMAKEFHRLYQVNITNIQRQPLPMAQWLNTNTPPDAVIAVHDVGMMRYVGQRHTLDMVGLTTPDAADYWRNGPGAVGEFLLHHQPDYVAAYTTARGLNYLADTAIYGELLVGFSASYDPADNVALGAEFQGIFRPDWNGDRQAMLLSTNVLSQLDLADTALTLQAEINVADLTSEVDYEYVWSNTTDESGFATEVYQFNYVDCPPDENCSVIDGGRRINGEEAFMVHLDPQLGDAVLITRLHPANRGMFDIYVNDQFVARRWIPEIPGRWLDVATVISSDLISSETRIRIIPAVDGGYYMPYYHWVVQDVGQFEVYEDPPLVTYQEAAIVLTDLRQSRVENRLQLDMTWQSNGQAQGDYRLFVHVYDQLDSEPVAQADGYVRGGLLPGNWLPGMITDTIMVDLEALPSDTYTLAVGFYESTTFERLLPVLLVERVGWWVDEAGQRLIIGDIAIP
jgi:hypothetical protein